MVSKVAVIAIVGILAVPILLGYALNLEQTTETDYKTTGDSVNVTPLLNNGIAYTYARANTYQLNTNFEEMQASIYPFYQKYTSTHTSAKLSFDEKSDGYIPVGTFYMSNYTQWAWRFEYNSSVGQLNVTLTNSNNQTDYVSKIHTLYYDSETKITSMTTYTTGYEVSTSARTFNDTVSISFSISGSYHADHTYQWYDRPVDTKYIDFSAGYRFHFNNYSVPIYSGENYSNNTIIFPDYTNWAIITINLSSITDANYSFGIGDQCYIEKTTNDGVVSWQVKPRPRINDNIVPVTDLYYDNNSVNNTYQIKVWIEPDGTPAFGSYYNFIQHYEFRYVGAWPALIGEANYYQKYDIEAQKTALAPNFNNLIIGGFSDHSPVMRIDDAEFRAMEIQVMDNITYNPSSFKTNPATSITNIGLYGKSITFANNTYNVNKEGKITLEGRDIPIKDLVFSSVPRSGGGYDNKIGNTVISTTATPSTITFNGKWSASVSTIAQEEYEVTKTEWKAGSFAWDGMDQNFLMVGLLASLGAFIALGIYARRSRASIWPLLLVCGGAALLFFVML